MQPYHKAAQRIREGEDAPLEFLKSAGSLGIKTAVGVGAANLGSKLVPAIGSLINKFIPDNLMEKGLQKVDPRFKAFIQGNLDQGYSMDDIREFLHGKLEKEQNQEEISPETPKNAKEHRNIIEQYSPELFQFIDQEVKKGKSLWTAGNEAVKNSKFSSIIKKMMKDHKAPWTAILETAFGNFRSGQQPQQQGNDVYYDYDRSGQSQQQGTNQPGQGQQALMAMLNNINQKLGQ